MYQMIRVPQPCTADWNAMSPAGNGRHCNQCCKTVVDFTDWENSDILAYLKEHAASGVCGHFRKEQLEIPIPTPEAFVQQVERSFLPFAQKIAAVFLFVFGIMAASCNNGSRQSGKPLEQYARHLPASPGVQLTGDTVVPGTNSGQMVTQEPAMVMGEPAMVTDTPVMPNEPSEVLGGAPEIEDVHAIVPVAGDTARRK